MGLDYVDDFETCRSMKHFYESSLPISSMPVSSPLSGTIVGVTTESGFAGGVLLGIQDPAQPAFTILIFHVNSPGTFSVGDTVTAGQTLGTTTGGDVAVGVNTPQGYRFVSFFETMTPGVFAPYQARGVATPQTLILTAAQRDADPLTCSGGTFTSAGTLPIRLALP